MSRLREILSAEYDTHFEFVAAPLDLANATRRTRGSIARTYGGLVSSIPAGGRVLDLACGPGLLLSWLASRSDLRCEGVDSSARVVEIARRNLPGVEVHLDDGLAFLRSRPRTYAGIFSTYFLEHVAGDDPLLEYVEAVREALAPGGFFCCRVPNAANLTSLWERYADLTHSRLFTLSSMRQLLQAGGLRAVRSVPIRGGLAVTASNLLQSALHRVLFLAAGRTNETIFTSSLCTVGYRTESGLPPRRGSAGSEAPASGLVMGPSLRAQSPTAGSISARFEMLHLGKYYWPDPGGMEQVLRSFVLAMGRRRAQCCVVACRTGRSRADWIDGALVYRLRAWGSILFAPILPTLPWVVHWLRRPAVARTLVLHLPNPFAVIALALSLTFRRKRERLVAWIHAEPSFARGWRRWLHAVYRPFERRVFRNVDRFVVATPLHIESFSSLAAYRETVSTVPYAVADTWFAEDARDEANAEDVRLQVGGRFALFVGRLAFYKGLEVLIEAAREIEGLVVIVGTGPLEAELRARVEGLGLQEKVRLVGWVEDLRPWYLASEFLVLPSTLPLEAFGVVQLEAMALGRTVVTTDLATGVTWVNRDGETGLVVPTGDAGALAAACNRLFADDELRSRLAERAKARARAEFSFEAMVRQWEHLEERLAKGSRD